MFIRQTRFKKLATTLSVVLVLLGGMTVLAEESARKEEPVKKTEPTPEEKGVLDFRAYRPGDSIFKNRGVEAPSSSIRLPRPSAPSTSRQDRELLDRQKNWIFLSPKDASKTESPEEILGVDSLSLEKEDSKSALRKFLENKPVEGATSGFSATGLNRNEPRGSFRPFTAVPQEQKATGSAGLNQPGFDTLLSGNNSSAQPTLSQRWQTLNVQPTEKMREERRAQMTQFENLFSPPNTLPAANGFGVLNTGNNFGIQRDAAASSGNLDRFRPPQIPKVGDSLHPQIPGVIPGSSVTAPGGINARTFGSSALPAVTPEPPRNVSQPVNLPVPKRRF